MGSDSEVESSISVRSSQIDFADEGPSPSNPESKYMKKNVSGTSEIELEDKTYGSHFVFPPDIAHSTKNRG